MRGVVSMVKKRLYRSRKDYMIAGVCGGIDEYFDVDSTLVRLLAVLVVLLGGAGIIVYLIAWIIIPKNPEQISDEAFDKREKFKENVKKGAEDVIEEVKGHLETRERTSISGKNERLLGGIIIIIIGVIFLLNSFFPWIVIGRLWPLILIAAGIIFIIQAYRK
jgi:phage shock protein C